MFIGKTSVFVSILTIQTGSNFILKAYLDIMSWIFHFFSRKSLVDFNTIPVIKYIIRKDQIWKLYRTPNYSWLLIL